MTSGESEKIKVDGTLYQKHAQGGIIFTEKNRGARKHRVTQALGFWKLEETVCRVAGVWLEPEYYRVSTSECQ